MDALVKENRKVGDSPTGPVYYMRYKIPMLGMRDSVFCVNLQKQDNGDMFFNTFSVERDDEAPKKDVIRTFQEYLGYFKQHKDEPTTYTYTEFGIINLGGYVPVALMNMILSTSRKDELRKFYECIKADKEQ